MLNEPDRILLVDDEPSNLYLLEELLQSEGYETFAAESGQSALTLANSCHPDLILLDVMMPEMDGFEVCKNFRADPDLQTVPIIFLTALDDDQSRLKGLEMMGDDYFTKPIKSSLLLSKIANVLRLSKMRSQVSQIQARARADERTNRQLEAAWKINENLSEKFRLFVPEEFLERIAPKGVESIQLGNVTEEEITVLFADIRGFTTISESQTAKETFSWLNAFFTQMGEVITSCHGFIDKFLGDALIAVFLRPHYHSEDALLASILMQKSLSKFNQNRDRYHLIEPIRIGIGIHTGMGVIGTLGSAHRMDSTVIGDVVNTAARLQELTKVYSTPIIASQAVINQLKQPTQLHWRWIDQVTPRGKLQAIDLCEILGIAKDILDENKLEYQAIFALAIQEWKQGNFATSLNNFQKIVEINPEDTVANLYLELCQARLVSAPSSITSSS